MVAEGNTMIGNQSGEERKAKGEVVRQHEVRSQEEGSIRGRNAQPSGERHCTSTLYKSGAKMKIDYRLVQGAHEAVIDDTWTDFVKDLSVCNFRIA